MTVSTDFTHVTLVSEDTYGNEDEDKKDEEDEEDDEDEEDEEGEEAIL